MTQKRYTLTEIEAAYAVAALHTLAKTDYPAHDREMMRAIMYKLADQMPIATATRTRLDAPDGGKS